MTTRCLESEIVQLSFFNALLVSPMEMFACRPLSDWSVLAPRPPLNTAINRIEYSLCFRWSSDGKTNVVYILLPYPQRPRKVGSQGVWVSVRERIFAYVVYHLMLLVAQIISTEGQKTGRNLENEKITKILNMSHVLTFPVMFLFCLTQLQDSFLPCLILSNYFQYRQHFKWERDTVALTRIRRG